MTKSDHQPPGPGVDAQGRSVVDPTANVIAILQAAVQRQDDLRDAESRHLREVVALEARHAAELREAESKRIDAIRAVDVGAVNRAAEVQSAAATALAAQLAATAEASRTQVAAAAAAQVTSLAAALEPIQKDIRDLRDAQNADRGSKEQTVEARDSNRFDTTTLVAVMALILAAIGVVKVFTG